MLNSAEQSQNDFLQEWISKRETFLQLLLQLEGRSDNGLCRQCGDGDGLFRCIDCIGDLNIAWAHVRGLYICTLILHGPME
jgi:hypothetical protein